MGKFGLVIITGKIINHYKEVSVLPHRITRVAIWNITEPGQLRFMLSRRIHTVNKNKYEQSLLGWMEARRTYIQKHSIHRYIMRKPVEITVTPVYDKFRNEIIELTIKEEYTVSYLSEEETEAQRKQSPLEVI